MKVRNLPYIRSLDPKLHEAMLDIINGQEAVTQQTNANPAGQPLPPPGINGVRVTERDGFAHIAISDENQIYRGIRYFVEHADNPQFTSSQIYPMQDSRNAVIPIGNQTRYFRAYSAYSATAAGPPAYHGDAANPLPVRGTGATAGPLYGQSMGSGTGQPGEGLSGPGPIPFRTLTGAPPTRGE